MEIKNNIPIFKLKIPDEEGNFNFYNGNFTKVLTGLAFANEELIIRKCLLKSLKIFHTLKKNPVKKLLINLSKHGVCNISEQLFINFKKFK